MKTLLSTVCFAALTLAASANTPTSNPGTPADRSVGDLPEFVVTASRAETTVTAADTRVGQMTEYIVVERAPAASRKTAAKPAPAEAAKVSEKTTAPARVTNGRIPPVASAGF